MTEIWRVYVCSHRSPFRWTLILRGTKLQAWEAFDHWWRCTEKGDGLRLVLEIGQGYGRIMVELWHPEQKWDLRAYQRLRSRRVA